MPHQPEGVVWSEDGSLERAVPGQTQSPLAAYVHVPFCTVRCGYCDFNTYTTGFGEGADLETYANSVVREIELSARVLGEGGWDGRPFESVFFGGGTPSLLSPGSIGRILAALRSHFGIAADAEVTLEANPETLDEERARQFAEVGINRFSIGMQSGVSHVLKVLDRTHNPANVPVAVTAAQAAGCQVSVDLIYGAPGESLADWETSLRQAIALKPDHISAYSLIIEEGTKMGRELAAGLIPPSNPDLDAEKYELADALLGEAGYHWYEISNFSTSPRTRSTHNLAYWQDWDWWGYGPGAHSHVGGQRWWNVKHPRAYAGRLEQGVSPGFAGENLSAEDRRVEAVMLGVRTDLGVEIPPDVSLQSVSRLTEEGLIQEEAVGQGRIILTLRGRLLADYVTRVLLGWE